MACKEKLDFYLESKNSIAVDSQLAEECKITLDEAREEMMTYLEKNNSKRPYAYFRVSVLKSRNRLMMAILSENELQDILIENKDSVVDAELYALSALEIMKSEISNLLEERESFLNLEATFPRREPRQSKSEPSAEEAAESKIKSALDSTMKEDNTRKRPQEASKESDASSAADFNSKKRMETGSAAAQNSTITAAQSKLKQVAESKVEKADSRVEKADSRVEKAGSKTEKAGSKTEKAAAPQRKKNPLRIESSDDEESAPIEKSEIVQDENDSKIKADQKLGEVESKAEIEVENDDQEEAEFEVCQGSVKTEKQLLALNEKTPESSTAIVGAVPVQAQKMLEETNTSKEGKEKPTGKEPLISNFFKKNK